MCSVVNTFFPPNQDAKIPLIFLDGCRMVSWVVISRYEAEERRIDTDVDVASQEDE